ncbi:hypothetical protein D3C73_1046680 [compost metagenome]
MILNGTNIDCYCFCERQAFLQCLPAFICVVTLLYGVDFSYFRIQRCFVSEGSYVLFIIIRINVGDYIRTL